MIKVQKLKRTFGDVKAVGNVSFQAEDAQVTALLGTNGAGKTTTLRMIEGLLCPDAGSVQIDSVNAIQSPIAAKELLGIFTDKFGLYSRLNVREHLSFFGGLHGLRGSTLKNAIEDVADSLELGSLLLRKTEGFSTGQAMKVALAQCLIHRPQNLILDEPTRGLDIYGIRLLRDKLKQLRNEGRCRLTIGRDRLFQRLRLHRFRCHPNLVKEGFKP
jgi:sodium transport system ATP-binding protein